MNVKGNLPDGIVDVILFLTQESYFIVEGEIEWNGFQHQESRQAQQKINDEIFKYVSQRIFQNLNWIYSKVN